MILSTGLLAAQTILFSYAAALEQPTSLSPMLAPTFAPTFYPTDAPSSALVRGSSASLSPTLAPTFYPTDAPSSTLRRSAIGGERAEERDDIAHFRVRKHKMCAESSNPPPYFGCNRR